MNFQTTKILDAEFARSHSLQHLHKSETHTHTHVCWETPIQNARKCCSAWEVRIPTALPCGVDVGCLPFSSARRRDARERPPGCRGHRVTLPLLLIHERTPLKRRSSVIPPCLLHVPCSFACEAVSGGLAMYAETVPESRRGECPRHVNLTIRTGLRGKALVRRHITDL